MPLTTREESSIAGLRPRETAFSSDRIKREWSQKIKDEALFGARITHRAYLDAVKKRLVEVVGGTITPQEAERRLKETLRDLGYSPEGGFKGKSGGVPPAKPGDIRDLSSSRRIQLIIDTNVKRARSMGQVAASENPLSLMTRPAWELTRTGARKKPRGDWKRRWAAAGAKVGWEGAAKRRMVALKSSPIWQALADGTGGYTDTLGSPFPPFAFGSGLAWVNVGRKEWQRICREEGMPDGLEEVAARAKEYMREGGEETGKAEPVKIDVALPPLGDKPQGVANPLTVKLEEIAKEVPPPGAVSPTAGAYRPNYSVRDEANNAVDDALDKIKGAEATLAKWLEELGEFAQGAAIGKYSEYMENAATELRSLEGRVVNYGGAISTEPPPRNISEQTAYDSSMRRYAMAAEATARQAQRMLDAAKLRRLAAEKAASSSS